jgi:hypothetical protein
MTADFFEQQTSKGVSGRDFVISGNIDCEKHKGHRLAIRARSIGERG